MHKIYYIIAHARTHARIYARMHAEFFDRYIYIDEGTDKF